LRSFSSDCSFGFDSRRCALPALALALAVAVPAEAAELLVMSQGTQEVLEYDGLDGSFRGAFADTITDGFRLPGGIAVRPSDGVLYVASVSTGEIWAYDSDGDPMLPAVAVGLFAPFGIDFDASGSHLYFADASTVDKDLTDAVKQLDVTTGAVTTLGTNNQADLLGVAVNGADVFATDIALHRILRFPVSGGPETAVVSTGLSQPGALLFPTATQMLVADSGNDRVVEYLETGGSWVFEREVLAASAGVQEPCGLALAPDGRLTVSGRGSGDVVLVELTSGVVTPLVAPGAGGLSDPTGLAWSGSSLLVASPSGNAIFYFDASGQPTGVRADGLSAALDAGIELSPDGSRLFVGSIVDNDVIEFDVASGARVRTYTQACPNLPFPFDLALGPDARLYVSCTLNHSIEHFDATSGAALGSFVIAGFGGLQSPRSLAFGPNGNLFVSNGTAEILEYEGSTGAAVGPPAFVDATGNGGGAIDPWGLRFHEGVLYVASFSSAEVKAFDATTGAFLSNFVPSGSGGLSGPTALDFGRYGDLYVASQDDHAVRRYDGGTGDFVEVFVPSGAGGLDTPFDLAFRTAVAQPVPALSHGARALLLAAIAAAAVYGLRRRAGMRTGKEDEA
jgi:DNA-binding beta-propeller fold protein YncE